jgi:hypothetical protein
VVHVSLDVNRQVIISPLAGVKVQETPEAPAIGFPFLNHSMTGVDPPLTGIAVYVTPVPAQTGLAEAVIITLTGSNGLTVILLTLDTAGFIVGQVAEDVSKHEIALLLVSILVKVASVAPVTGVESISH